jgi:hypothetical protein
VTSKPWFKPLLAVLAVFIGFHVWLHFAVTRCLGCTGVALAAPVAGPFPVAIVPGCPSMKDGGMSGCQWRRVLWAAHLYETGQVAQFITSGSAVYNRFVEADALRAGLASLGVPLDLIHTETRALHTDENLGFSLPILQGLGHDQVAVASDGAQVVVACAMLRMWGTDCLSLPVDEAWVEARMTQGVPLIRTMAVPRDTWMDLGTRETARAESRGSWARLPSPVVYVWGLLKGLAGHGAPPPLPAEGL